MRCSNVDRNKSTIPKAPVHPRADQSGTKVAKTARSSFFGFQRVWLGRDAKIRKETRNWDIMGYHGNQWTSMGFSLFFMGKANLFSKLILKIRNIHQPTE